MTRLVRVLALLALVCAHDAATTWAAEEGEWVLDANHQCTVFRSHVMQGRSHRIRQ